MELMKDQLWASPQRGLPVHVMDASASSSSISGETVQLFYSNSGVRTTDAGQAAGTAVEGKLAYNKIMNAAGSMLGTFSDTSLSFTSTAFTTLVNLGSSSVPLTRQQFEALDSLSFAQRLSAITVSMSNGDYFVDHRTGTIYGKKASTQTSLASAAYKIQGSSGGTGSSASQIQGNVAAGATDSGNPVKTGGVYNTTAPTYTNGQRTDIQADVNGNTQVNLYTSIFGENATSNVMMTSPKAISELTNAISIDKSAALEASSVTKASSGRLYGATVRVDSTLASGTYYIQFLNAASLPADGAVTTLVAPQKVIHTNGTDDNISFDWSGWGGVPASTGIVMCLSTTEYTKTISGAYTSSTIFYA